MRIRRIQLRNGYKRFHDLTIYLGDTPKRIVALIGPNGCGKSSVLDGMLFRQNYFGYNIGGKGPKDYKFHSMEQHPNFLTEKNVAIDFVEGDFDEIVKQKRSIGKQNTIFSFRSPYRYNSNLKVRETKAVSDISTNQYGASATIDLDDKMEQNYRQLQIKYHNYLHTEDCRPSAAKKKIIGDLNNSLRNCLALEIDTLGDIQAGKGTIYFKKRDHPMPFEFNVLSAGEKEVVDILLDIYLRQESYDDSVYLIDEPELHINTAIQRQLLSEINKLVPKNCQIWIATHSIGFIQALQEDFNDESQIIEFKDNVNWASEKQILKPIEKSRANWKSIFFTALDDLSNLICPKTIIYCEGKTEPNQNGEEKGLDAKVYNNIFSEKYPDTLFVSSGGNTEPDQRSEIAIKILSKAIKDLEIIVLKDRDIKPSGNSTEAQDREIYLQNNPKNHRMLQRREIENYLFDKEVLKKYCGSQKSVFKEEEYNTFVEDIHQQNLKDEISKIKGFCSIDTSINKEIFKENLSEVITEGMSIYTELENAIFKR